MTPETSEPSEQMPQLRTLPRICLYVVTWLVALFVTDPSLKFWSLAYLFPLGLAAFVNLRLGNDGGWWVLIAGYAIYLAHAVFFFRSKTMRSTLLWLGLLVILLICNISGCKAQLPH